MNIMSADNNVYPGIFSFKSIDDVLLLHHAAGDANGKVLPLCHLLFLELAQGAEESLVGVIPDTAGVEEDYIGVLPVACRYVSLIYEHACHDLRVVLVHLATEGLYKKCFTHAFLSCP